MKTIKELTEIIKVSKVSIYKAIKRDDIKEHIINRDNMTYVDETGEQLLTALFKLNSKVYSKVKTSENDEILFLRKQIEKLNVKNDDLQSELSKEREHSRNIAEQLAMLTDNAQKLQAAQLTDGKKPGLFSRLFRKQDKE